LRILNADAKSKRESATTRHISRTRRAANALGALQERPNFHARRAKSAGKAIAANSAKMRAKKNFPMRAAQAFMPRFRGS
jgi:hypothetical protein